jgi:putative ABC transport system permease protein
LVQGTLDLLLLKILALEPLNGLAISQRLKQISGNILQVSDGSLYPALHILFRFACAKRKEDAMRFEHWIYTIPLRLRSLFRRRRVEQELDEELRYHLERKTEELLAQGMTPENARRAANRAMDGLELRKEQCRDARGLRFLENLDQDTRYAVRMLRKSPGFTTVAVLTLALGIGANTAMFSVVNAALLSPLPYSDPDRLVLVKEVLPHFSTTPVSVSGPDIRHIRKLNHSFEDIAGFRGRGMDLAGNDGAERVYANRVSSSLFPVLGMQPMIGRNFTEEEEQPGENVVILGYILWQRRFAGSREIVGKSVTLDRKPYTVIGVMPKSFVFPLPGMSAGSAADLFIPLALTKGELEDLGDNFDWGVMGKLKPGIDLSKAHADLEIVAQGVLATYGKDMPRDFKLGVVAQPLVEQVVGPARPMLMLLLGAVGFVLLIACANIANLMLVRASARTKELAVRLAIGAGRGRLLQQLVAEGMLLSFAGGGLGLVVGVWFKNALAAGLPASVPKAHAIELDVRVLVFTMALALTAGLVFGILPGLSAMRTDPTDALKEGGRGSEGAENQRLRATLVAAEVAFSMMLLVGAGLLLRSFERVLETKPGFEPTHVLTAQINVPDAQYPKEEMVYAFYRGLLERLRQAPGIRAAGTSTDMPLLGQWKHLFTPEGYTPAPGVKYNLCYHSVISGDYLQAMGIPLLRGRYFNEQDRIESTHVLIVSDALAKRYWPNQDALGKRLKWGPPESHDPWLTVVGVAGDVKQGPLEAATLPHTYEYYAQLGAIQNLVVAVSSEGNPEALAAGLRAAVWGLDRQMAVDRVRTMDQVIGKSTAVRRFNLFLIGAFAALALLLAAIGIYGVLAFSVSKRAHEIGIRIALGARSSDVALLVMGQASRLVGIGIFVGGLGALLLGRFLQSMLFEIRPIDPLTFVGVVIALGAATWAASYLPARRAMRVDPMVALRYE